VLDDRVEFERYGQARVIDPHAANKAEQARGHWLADHA
jgi:hypothetical protein